MYGLSIKQAIVGIAAIRRLDICLEGLQNRSQRSWICGCKLGLILSSPISILGMICLSFGMLFHKLSFSWLCLNVIYLSSGNLMDTNFLRKTRVSSVKLHVFDSFQICRNSGSGSNTIQDVLTNLLSAFRI